MIELARQVAEELAGLARDAALRGIAFDCVVCHPRWAEVVARAVGMVLPGYAVVAAPVEPPEELRLTMWVGLDCWRHGGT